MNFLLKYNHFLVTKPLLTKSITGGFIFSLSDAIVQWVEQRDQQKKSLSLYRVGIAYIMGSVVMTPLIHFQYSYLLPWMMSKLPIKNISKFQRIAISVFIDQTIWSSFIVCHYLLFINILEHHSITQGFNQIENNFIKVMLTNWKIWPIAQVINFRFIPQQYQVLWVNFIGLFWYVYLSYIQHV